MDQLKYKIHTFGCKVNTYDSGLVGKNLNQKGFLADSTAEPQVHILNTCAVTEEATKEALRLARRLKSKNPLSLVVVTGCGAQVDTGHFESLPGIDLVIANSHKSDLPFIIQKYYKGEITEKVFKSNIFQKEDLEEGGGEESHHTRAFLKIQDGCNSFCTYCVIPFARGKSRSLSVSTLVEKINSLHQQGVQEVVLTGVHIGDYESEKSKLEDLIENVLRRTKIPRIRLTSLEPIEVSDRLLDLYQDPRMCPHFHMSIQSANSTVLAAMKRSYSQQQVVDSLQKIHEHVPKAFVGMDVIVGFPTETHEEFEDTYLTLSRTPWTRIHVFPYSSRPGTFAARLANQVSPRELGLRSQRLRELSLQRYQDLSRMQVGQIKKVLVLKDRKNGFQGLSRDYWNIQFQNLSNLQVGHEVNTRILSLQENSTKKMESPLLAEVLV